MFYMDETLQNNIKKYHFIGICGKAMGTLAVMLKNQGHIVSGSDMGFYEPMLSYLKDNDINLIEGHEAKNIPDDVDYIIIGRHAKLVPETNDEVKYAFTMPEKVKSLPQIINSLTKNKDTIICAGSFGKSTITSLTSFVLKYSNKNPSYFIGAVPIDLQNSGELNDSEIFILEGDEYPSANFDNSAKFLHYNPQNVILTSCEPDHINVYPTKESYLVPYIELVKIIPESGVFVYAKDGALIESDVLKFLNKDVKKISYGFNNADYTAKNINYAEITNFDIYKKDEFIVNIKTNLLGIHNIENILGVSAMLLEKKLITKDELQIAIENFHGVMGRLDKKTSENKDALANKIPIIESYGSSYAKAKADIDAIKLHYKNKNIIAIFEPHTFGWRNRDNLSWYNDIFNGIEYVYVFQPPVHGASTHAQLNQKEIIDQIKINREKDNENIFPIESKDQAYELLEKHIKNDTLILLITSGSLDELPILLPEKINF